MLYPAAMLGSTWAMVDTGADDAIQGYFQRRNPLGQPFADATLAVGAFGQIAIGGAMYVAGRVRGDDELVAGGSAALVDVSTDGFKTKRTVQVKSNDGGVSAVIKPTVTTVALTDWGGKSVQIRLRAEVDGKTYQFEYSTVYWTVSRVLVEGLAKPTCAKSSDCKGTFCYPESCKSGVCEPTVKTGTDQCYTDSNIACRPSNRCYQGQCLFTQDHDAYTGAPCTEQGCKGSCQGMWCSTSAAWSCSDKAGGCQKLSGCESDGKTCKYTVSKDGAKCSDGDACTGGETCTGGKCSGAKTITCDDKNACTADSCNKWTGCKHTAKSCDDGNACTKDSCDAKTGKCTSVASDGAPCDDGQPCTKGDTCAKSTCAAGKSSPCNDGVACTQDSCDAKTGKCTNKPQHSVCGDGAWLSTKDGKTYFDGCSQLVCDVKKGCVAIPAPNGTRPPGYALSPLKPDDPARRLVCAAGKAVDECTLQNTPCKWCTSSYDASKGWSCLCNDPNAKLVAGTWTWTHAGCDDGNPCTKDDACVPNKTVNYLGAAPGECKGTPAAKGTKCNDGNPCTWNPGKCDGNTTCKAEVFPWPAKCDDGDACTVNDRCNGGKCVGQKAKEGAPCHDGNLCTLAGTCKSGTCTLKPKCTFQDAGDLCSATVCAPATGECVAKPLNVVTGYTAVCSAKPAASCTGKKAPLYVCQAGVCGCK